MRTKRLNFMFVLGICFLLCLISISGLLKKDGVVYASQNLDNALNMNQEPAENFTDVKYITNSNYFIANPSHHSNNTGLGVCSTVALQMLLGYHNYYTDRRLIPSASEDGKQFLAENYGDLNIKVI